MYFPPGSFPASSSRHERFKRLLGEQFWDWQTNTLNWSRLKGKSGFQIDASFTCFEKIFPNMLVRGHCLHTKQVLHRFCNYIFLFFFKIYPRSVPLSIFFGLLLRAFVYRALHIRSIHTAADWPNKTSNVLSSSLPISPWKQNLRTSKCAFIVICFQKVFLWRTRSLGAFWPRHQAQVCLTLSFVRWFSIHDP